MGVTLSTLGLMSVSLLSAAFSVLTAYEVKEKNWSRSTLIASVAVGCSILSILFALGLVIAYKSSPMSALEGMAFGVMLAFILLILAMSAVAFSQVATLVEIRKKNTARVYELSLLSAAISIGSVVMALLLILFLL